MANRQPARLPALSKRSWILLGIVLVLLVLLIVAFQLLPTYIDWLWYGEVGFRSVFTTTVITRVLLFVITGAVVGALVWVSLLIAYRTRPVFVPVTSPDDPVARYRSVVLRRLRLFSIAIPVVIGLLVGSTAQNDWSLVQLFLHGTSFGQQDPIFHIEVGFFVFQLPFYEWVLNWLLLATVLSFIGALIAHYIFGSIRLTGKKGQLASAARIQLSIIAGIFVLFKAMSFLFERYDLLFSTSNQQANGATYTEINAVVPAKMILLCIAVICAVTFFAGAFLRDLRLPALATALLVLSSLLLGLAWPAVLQQFVVAPNANQKEAQPISYNITATKQAYGLTDDKVVYQNYSNKPTASPDQIRSDTSTVANARLLDPNVISATFTQFQQGRNFYSFPAKLGIDRYTINGQTNDYIVAAREVNTSALADAQKNWINEHLVYTHGNGFVAAKANTVNSAGYPDFQVSELNSDGNISNGFEQVDQPRIYYGEQETSNNDYAIVGVPPGQKGQEYDTDKTTYAYDGAGGVPMGNWFNRLVFAANYGEPNILFNSAIGENSKILYNRDPQTRVKKVAPWLTVDSNPYPAVIGGKIEWIVDGYTTLKNYPYAQQTLLGDATNDSLNQTIKNNPRQSNKTISYIRNSVKATVDAYTGAVTLYSIDDSDPVLKAWESVFPSTVKPSSDISAELRSHFRYPEDLFKVQRELIAKYHVTNSQDFYSQISFWNVPQDPTVDSTTNASDIQNLQSQPQPAYYVLSGSPNSSSASFQLTSPLTFLGRDFMAAYVTAASDPKNYGQITVLQLPSDTQTPGPKLVQTQFITANGQQLNLFRQQSTKLAYGNLLTLPVGGGLLYVEPVYVEQSSNQSSSYPQLSRVLVSYNGGIGFAPTFTEALNQALAGNNSGQSPNPNQPPASSTPTPTPSSVPPAPNQAISPDLAKAIDDIQSALQQIKSAQQSGNFTALGQAYAALDDATKRFEAAKGTTNPTPTTSPSSGGR